MERAGAPSVDQTHRSGGDRASDPWVARLADPGPERDETIAELHALLLKFARVQVSRRAARFRVTGPEVDDLAYQATADALVSIVAKLADFRGESRFTTWAYKFVLLEVANKLGRHFWRDAPIPDDAVVWDRLPDRFGLEPEREAEWRDMAATLLRGVDTELTDRQRTLFVSIVLKGVPLDAVAIAHGSNRNAIYKSLFDARRKLRACLVAEGYLDPEQQGVPS